MVKVVIFPRTENFPGSDKSYTGQQIVLTRYPCFPRRVDKWSRDRSKLDDGFRDAMIMAELNTSQLYVEFSGTDLLELLRAVKCALSWSSSLLGRVPEYLSQRFGESACLRHALDSICGTLDSIYLHSIASGISFRDHYFSVHPFKQLLQCSYFKQPGIRSFTSAYVPISSCVSFHLNGAMLCRYLREKLRNKEHLLKIVLEFLNLWPEAAGIVALLPLSPTATVPLPLSKAMRLGVYALTVHARMFNAVPRPRLGECSVQLAMEAVGSFQNWIASADEWSERWRDHGQSPAVVGRTYKKVMVWRRPGKWCMRPWQWGPHGDGANGVRPMVERPGVFWPGYKVALPPGPDLPENMPSGMTLVPTASLTPTFPRRGSSSFWHPYSLP